MNNVELIAAAQANAGIVEPCHTYAHWKNLGYQVKKGSKALFRAKIWKYANKKDESEEDEHVFMKTASFFGLSQVDRLAQ